MEQLKLHKPVAITCGDPAGIGPEIIHDWIGLHSGGTFADCNQPPSCVVLGPAAMLDGLPEASWVERRVVGDPDFRIHPGQPGEDGARIALEAMESAATGCSKGEYSCVVTGPVSKYWLQQVGYTFPGQTEFFAHHWGGEPTMAFAGSSMRLVLATWHIPLAAVPGALTRPVLERAVERAVLLAEASGFRAPRIGVCGLNPHAGEGGLLGMEEQTFLNPWLEGIAKRFEPASISHCLPADSLFYRHRQGEVDAVVALYHDQGLGPLKSCEFDSAVNITLGLPHVRTSPDHGTAFERAGKGQASWKSLHNAVQTAARLAAHVPIRRSPAAEA